MTPKININGISIFINNECDFECSCGYTTALRTKFNMHLVKKHGIEKAVSLKNILKLEDSLLEELEEDLLE